MNILTGLTQIYPDLRYLAKFTHLSKPRLVPSQCANHVPFADIPYCRMSAKEILVISQDGKSFKTHVETLNSTFWTFLGGESGSTSITIHN
jgi:hypothetical protein